MVTPERVTVESGVRYSDEDDGRSAIAEVTDGHVSVRIQEWHAEPGDHVVVPALAGQRVRVTIEVLTDAVYTPHVPRSPCPYCEELVPDSSVRCKHCQGELRFCRRCNLNQGVYSKQKLVGASRVV